MLILWRLRNFFHIIRIQSWLLLLQFRIFGKFAVKMHRGGLDNVLKLKYIWE